MDTDIEKKAIARLKAFEPEEEPYYLCYSGGKDSDCIRILADLAGVAHEIHHNLTTVDAPETVRYVKSIPGVIIDKNYYSDGTPITMWNLIPRKKTPPTRLSRYCCEILKEHGGKGRMKITGVRADESTNRRANGGIIKIIGDKNVYQYIENSNAEYIRTKQGGIVMNYDDTDTRRVTEHCFRTSSVMVNPIYDWTDDDVWAFLKHYGCKSNPLYYMGCSRVGCIGCPMSRKREREQNFIRYPAYKRNYIKAFDRMIDARKKAGMSCTWETGWDVFNWWVEDTTIPGQMSFFDAEP